MPDNSPSLVTATLTVTEEPELISAGVIVRLLRRKAAGFWSAGAEGGVDTGAGGDGADVSAVFAAQLSIVPENRRSAIRNETTLILRLTDKTSSPLSGGNCEAMLHFSWNTVKS